MSVTVKFNVNGVPRTVTTDGDRRLLDVLREDLQLTGTKYGCGEGQCRACTVLVEGKRTASCMVKVASVEGKEVTTIEGLAQDGKLHPVQEAFIEKGAMQCGYCTSGMILAATALLREKPKPSEEEIVSWMNGNICRCNGYVKIIEAIQHASQLMGGQGDE